jgi:hypothetical protein
LPASCSARAVGIDAVRAVQEPVDSFVNAARAGALRVHTLPTVLRRCARQLRALAVMTQQRSPARRPSGDRRGRSPRAQIGVVGHRHPQGHARRIVEQFTAISCAGCARGRCAAVREPGRESMTEHAGRLHADDAREYLRYQTIAWPRRKGSPQ